MTDDAPPIPLAPPDENLVNEAGRNTNPAGDGSTSGRNDEPGRSNSHQSRRRRRRKAVKPDPGLVKKFEFLGHLLKSLDMLVYTELAALYYMECSTVRFFLRAWCQQNFLSPKSDDWPIPLPAIQAQVLSVFFPTIVCVLAHIFQSLPFAGETTRGYLHGGVIVDFIGQKPPSTRLTFLAFDVFIFGLQCLMLSVHEERERVRNIIRPKRVRRGLASSSTDNQEDAPRDPASTDVPAAAPSMLGSRSGATNPDDIELQPLSREDSTGDNDERRPFLASSHSPSPSPSRITLLDVMNSGNGMLRDFDVVHTVQNATPDFRGAVGHGLRSAGYQAALARIRARRRAAPVGQDQV